MEQVSRYSLPRHTNLASIGARFSAAITDLAIFIATAAILFFGCSNLIFTNCWTNSMNETMEKYDIDSHLVIAHDGSKSTYYESVDDYTVFDTPMRYYYLNYLTGLDVVDPDNNASPDYNKEITLDDGSKVLPKDLYTPYWYNVNILEINPSDPFGENVTCFFKAQTNELNEPDLNVIGIAQDKEYDELKGLTNTDRATFMRLKYRAACNQLSNQEYYLSIYKNYIFLSTLSGMIPLLISGIICYVIIPWFFKYQKTLGKLIFKIGLASIDGFIFDKRRLLLRFTPFLLVWALSTFLTYYSFFITIVVLVVILISSFAVMMASPKHTSLHDYTAQSIVIDAQTSILFTSHIEEDDYVIQEDKAEEMRILNKKNNG